MIGQAYHVTFATSERRRFFNDFRRARAVMRVFGDLDYSGDTRTHTFMLMPDHVHWLFTLNAGTLSRTVARAKTLSSRDVRVLCPEIETVWQKDFYDHALLSDESFRVVGDYIVANPVRAGIAEDIRAYPHWFADWV